MSNSSFIGGHLPSIDILFKYQVAISKIQTARTELTSFVNDSGLFSKKTCEDFRKSLTKKNKYTINYSDSLLINLTKSILNVLSRLENLITQYVQQNIGNKTLAEYDIYDFLSGYSSVTSFVTSQVIPLALINLPEFNALKKEYKELTTFLNNFSDLYEEFHVHDVVANIPLTQLKTQVEKSISPVLSLMEALGLKTKTEGTLLVTEEEKKEKEPFELENIVGYLDQIKNEIQKNISHDQLGKAITYNKKNQLYVGSSEVSMENKELLEIYNGFSYVQKLLKQINKTKDKVEKAHYEPNATDILIKLKDTMGDVQLGATIISPIIDLIRLLNKNISQLIKISGVVNEKIVTALREIVIILHPTLSDFFKIQGIQYQLEIKHDMLDKISILLNEYENLSFNIQNIEKIVSEKSSPSKQIKFADTKEIISSKKDQPRYAPLELKIKELVKEREKINTAMLVKDIISSTSLAENLNLAQLMDLYNKLKIISLPSINAFKINLLAVIETRTLLPTLKKEIEAINHQIAELEALELSNKDEGKLNEEELANLTKEKNALIEKLEGLQKEKNAIDNSIENNQPEKIKEIIIPKPTPQQTAQPSGYFSWFTSKVTSLVQTVQTYTASDLFDSSKKSAIENIESFLIASNRKRQTIINDIIKEQQNIIELKTKDKSPELLTIQSASQLKKLQFIDFIKAVNFLTEIDNKQALELKNAWPQFSNEIDQLVLALENTHLNIQKNKKDIDLDIQHLDFVKQQLLQNITISIFQDLSGINDLEFEKKYITTLQAVEKKTSTKKDGIIKAQEKILENAQHFLTEEDYNHLGKSKLEDGSYKVNIIDSLALKLIKSMLNILAAAQALINLKDTNSYLERLMTPRPILLKMIISLDELRYYINMLGIQKQPIPNELTNINKQIDVVKQYVESSRTYLPDMPELLLDYVKNIGNEIFSMNKKLNNELTIFDSTLDDNMNSLITKLEYNIAKLEKAKKSSALSENIDFITELLTHLRTIVNMVIKAEGKKTAYLEFKNLGTIKDVLGSIEKIKEFVQKLISGTGANSSKKIEYILQFIHSTLIEIYPHLLKTEILLGIKQQDNLHEAEKIISLIEGYLIKINPESNYNKSFLAYQQQVLEGELDKHINKIKRFEKLNIKISERLKNISQVRLRDLDLPNLILLRETLNFLPPSESKYVNRIIKKLINEKIGILDFKNEKMKITVDLMKTKNDIFTCKNTITSLNYSLEQTVADLKMLDNIDIDNSKEGRIGTSLKYADPNFILRMYHLYKENSQSSTLTLSGFVAAMSVDVSLMTNQNASLIFSQINHLLKTALKQDKAFTKTKLEDETERLTALSAKEDKLSKNLQEIKSEIKSKIKFIKEFDPLDDKQFAELSSYKSSNVSTSSIVNDYDYTVGQALNKLMDNGNDIVQYEKITIDKLNHEISKLGKFHQENKLKELNFFRIMSIYGFHHKHNDFLQGIPLNKVMVIIQNPCSLMLAFIKQYLPFISKHPKFHLDCLVPLTTAKKPDQQIEAINKLSSFLILCEKDIFGKDKLFPDATDKNKEDFSFLRHFASSFLKPGAIIMNDNEVNRYLSLVNTTHMDNKEPEQAPLKSLSQSSTMTFFANPTQSKEQKIRINNKINADKSKISRATKELLFEEGCSSPIKELIAFIDKMPNPSNDELRAAVAKMKLNIMLALDNYPKNIYLVHEIYHNISEFKMALMTHQKSEKISNYLKNTKLFGKHFFDILDNPTWTDIKLASLPIYLEKYSMDTKNEPCLIIPGVIQNYLDRHRGILKGDFGNERAIFFVTAFIAADEKQDMLSKILILYTMLNSNTGLRHSDFQKTLAKSMGFKKVDHAINMLENYIKHLIHVCKPEENPNTVMVEIKRQIHNNVVQWEKAKYQNISDTSFSESLKKVKHLVTKDLVPPSEPIIVSKHSKM